MTREFTVVVNDVRVEGYPDPDNAQRKLFLHDGMWYDGWPISTDPNAVDDDGLLLWEADERSGVLYGVRYWMFAPEIGPEHGYTQEQLDAAFEDGAVL